MQKKQYISISQAGTFQTCTYQWQLQYQHGYSRRSEKSGWSTRGRVFHLAMAAALTDIYLDQFAGKRGNNADALEAARQAVVTWDVENRPADLYYFKEGRVAEDGIIHLPVSFAGSADEWEEMLTTVIELVRRTLAELNIPNNYRIVHVATGLAAMSPEWLMDNGASGVGAVTPLIEHWLELEVPGTNVVVRGVVDAVLQNIHDGQLEVVDWKTRKSFTDLKQEELNMQLGVYQYALNELYGLYVPIGTVYQIKSSLPKSPEFNQDDSPNQRYAKFEWFRPLSVVRNYEIQARLWENLVRHAQRIADIRKHEPFISEQPRAYGYPCNRCQFRDVCFAELHGHDAQHILNTMYEKREAESEEEDEQ